MDEQLLKVLCGPCGGKMRVRRTGEAVVCPHCSSHLRVPADATAGMRLEAESGSGVLSRVSSLSGAHKKSGSQTKSPSPQPSSESSPRTKTAGGVSRNAFVIVASYASAVTLALLWLLFTNRAHQLESLPDIRTLSDGEMQFVQFDAGLPPGHELGLNDSARFGDVRVTPVKVTREPITFEHYENATATSPPTKPVLKLWLKLENLSSSVAFPPYDAALMSHRTEDKDDPFLARANSFLCRRNQPRTLQNVFLNYDHPLSSDFNMVEHATGPLAMDAECVTYVASSEEAVDRVLSESGELLWRVQLRKGVHSSSRQGVTTLVDVVFSTDDIIQ